MSPEAFDKCVRENGRVRTISLKGDKFLRVCFKGGKSFSGEVRTKKKQSKADFLESR